MATRSDDLEARRRFLKSMAAVALAPLAGLAASLAAAASTTAPGPAVVAAGGVFLVNGWGLTRADLVALGLQAH